MISKISKFFYRSEFSCRCKCGQDTVDVILLAILEVVRAHFDAPVSITSGNRCVIHNEYVGGKPKSFHLVGKAADIQVKGVKPSEVYSFLTNKFPNQYGFGLYEEKGFVHIDSGDRVWRSEGVV